MSKNYDNWERLVAGVIKRQQIWDLCHQPSRTPSICSETSSDFSSSLDFQKPIPMLLSIKGAVRNTDQVIGNGRFGTSILTNLRRDVYSDQHYYFLSKGTQLVMKKLVGRVMVAEEEFSTLFGNCRHENVATPKAYYFSDKESFIFNDYYIQGSVHDMLHAKRHIIGYPKWDIRLKIAIGAALGVTYIHTQNMAHGNLKSSNIFVNSQCYGCVSDFGLAGITRMPEQEQVDLSYHASAFEFKNASQESDVYSFGVVLLELVTGRTSMELTAVPGVREMPRRIVNWALSVGVSRRSKLFSYPGMSSDQSDIARILQEISTRGELDHDADREEYRIHTFHFELIVEVEMTEVFRVAKRCLAKLPQDRPSMIEVVLMLENVASLGNTNTRKRCMKYLDKVND